MPPSPPRPMSRQILSLFPLRPGLQSRPLLDPISILVWHPLSHANNATRYNNKGWSRPPTNCWATSQGNKGWSLPNDGCRKEHGGWTGLICTGTAKHTTTAAKQLPSWRPVLPTLHNGPQQPQPLCRPITTQLVVICPIQTIVQPSPFQTKNHFFPFRTKIRFPFRTIFQLCPLQTKFPKPFSTNMDILYRHQVLKT